jgi:bacteriorhodopsin
MKNAIAPFLCITLFACMLFATGCDSNTGIVEVPTQTAEEIAASEARQAEYSKAMEAQYGKKRRK